MNGDIVILIEQKLAQMTTESQYIELRKLNAWIVEQLEKIELDRECSQDQRRAP